MTQHLRLFCVQKRVVAWRTIDVRDVRQAVGELFRQSAHFLPEDYLEEMRTARVQEHSPLVPCPSDWNLHIDKSLQV